MLYFVVAGVRGMCTITGLLWNESGQERKWGIDMAGTTEYEQINKSLGMVDGHAVMNPEDYQDPDVLYKALVNRIRKYHPSADITLVEKAYHLAKEAHKDQVRKSGSLI